LSLPDKLGLIRHLYDIDAPEPSAAASTSATATSDPLSSVDNLRLSVCAIDPVSTLKREFDRERPASRRERNTLAIRPV
jgi:hypothetical protein